MTYGVDAPESRKPDVVIDVNVSGKGKDGYTPVRGKDYWTEEDQTLIRDYVDRQVAESGGSGSGGNLTVDDDGNATFVGTAFAVDGDGNATIGG